MDLSAVSDDAQASVVLPPVITITDDDVPPMLLISSQSVTEDNDLMFTVRLNVESGKEVTVAYADAGTGSAESGTDYTALAGGTLTSAAGETSKTIDISVIGDAACDLNGDGEIGFYDFPSSPITLARQADN